MTRSSRAFDPTDTVRMRLARGRLTGAFAAVGVLATAPVPFVGVAGMAARPSAAPLVVAQALVAVLAFVRAARITDRQYVALNLAFLVTMVPLTVMTTQRGSLRSTEMAVVVLLVMGAVFCETRWQAATVAAGTTVGAVVLTVTRIVDPAEATVQVVGQVASFAVLTLVIRWLRESARGAIEAARTGEITDPLTGLLNRRGFERAGAAMWRRAARAEDTLAVLVADLDHFKLVNDTFGHSAGDLALQHVGSVLRAGVRAGDLAARLGGEEFAVLCRIHPGEGRALAERLRASVAEAISPTTVSIGLVEIGPRADAVELDAVWSAVSAADGCLYEAKRAGRDQVVELAR